MFDPDESVVDVLESDVSATIFCRDVENTYPSHPLDEILRVVVWDRTGECACESRADTDRRQLDLLTTLVDIMIYQTLSR